MQNKMNSTPITINRNKIFRLLYLLLTQEWNQWSEHTLFAEKLIIKNAIYIKDSQNLLLHKIIYKKNHLLNALKWQFIYKKRIEWYSLNL